LLDSYTQERRPQVRAVIDASIAMGQVVCISDPEEAARRDAAYLAGEVPPLPPFPGLTDGLICTDNAFACGTAAGLLSVHGPIESDGQTMRYDDAIPNGFHIIALDADAAAHLSDASKAAFAQISGRMIGITTDAAKAKAEPGRFVLDTSGKYKRFFDEHGAKALVVRPDYYVFGAVRDLRDLPALVDDLTARLSLQSTVESREQAEA
jgi:hypothetical protein